VYKKTSLVKAKDNLIKTLNIQSYRSIAFVGAGGKTSLMYALAKSMVAEGRRVLCTSTTRLWPISEHDALPYHLALTSDIHTLTSTIKQRLQQNPLLVLARDYEPSSAKWLGRAKWLGFDAATMTALIANLPLDIHIFIEADGAAMRPLKAPAPHEPVLPDTIDACLGVMGLDALGMPLAEPIVHRPDYLAACTGQALQSPITIETYLRLAMHPKGLFQYCPPNTPKLVFFNKTDKLKICIRETLQQAILAIPQPSQKMSWYCGSAQQQSAMALALS